MAQIEWYSKEEAAARMGSPERPLSPRRVLELAQAGRIQSKRERDPQTGQTVVRIHAGSVERYLDEQSGERPREVREPQTPQTLTKRGSELIELLRLLQAGAAGIATAQPARLWLTLQESEEYAGLPASFLVVLIRSGKLPALDVGRRRGGRWRIRQLDLQKIEAPLLMLPGA